MRQDVDLLGVVHSGRQRIHGSAPGNLLGHARFDLFEAPRFVSIDATIPGTNGAIPASHSGRARLADREP